MNTLLRDIRYAFRAIARAPLLTGAVLLALVAGIGLNAAVFSVLDGFWLQAPVEKSPSTFVEAIPSYSGWFDTEDEFHGFTVQDFDAIRARAKSLGEIAAFGGGAGAVKIDGDDSGQIGVGMVTCNVFHLFAPKNASLPAPRASL